MLSVVNYSSYRQDLYTSHGTFQGGVGRGVQKLKFVKKNMKVSWNFQLAGCRLWGRGGANLSWEGYSMLFSRNNT